METTARYSETADRSFTETELTAMSLTELKDLFNAEAEATCANPAMFKPIAKFSDKSNAVRRVWATLTEVPEDTEDDTTPDQFDTYATIVDSDPRSALVVCHSCGQYMEKRFMESVGSNWFCSDEDACEARANHAGEPTPVKEEKGKKAAKAPKVAGEKKPRGKYNDADRVCLLVSENPKRKGTVSYDRFEAYFASTTVGAAIANGITKADLIWDVTHNFIAIHPVTEEPIILEEV